MEKETLQRRLPREMLWADRWSLDTLITMPLGKELLQLYNDMRRDINTRRARLRALDVMNEVYYLSIRVVYERDKDADLRNYMDDIKADLGHRKAVDVVLMLMLHLLSMCDDKSETTARFTLLLREHFQTQLPLDFIEPMLDRLLCHRDGRLVHLQPSPCKPVELTAIPIDWYALTDGFSLQAINSLQMLWKDTAERMQVLEMVEKAYWQYSPGLFDVPASDMVSHDYFNNQRALAGMAEMPPMAAEDYADIDELEQQNMLLERRVAALESENAMLRSQLNMSKPKRAQERAFSLSLIVDYCKKKPQYDDVKHIVAMLYKLLRGGTDDEYNLVDSIDEEFARRSMGNTYNAPVGAVNQSGGGQENHFEGEINTLTIN